MHYCPYCSEPVSEKAKTCHNCKRMLDLEVLAQVFDTAEESEMKKSALRKIKTKENMRYIWPGITLIIGFIIGGIFLYLFSLAQFALEKNDLTTQIDSLHRQINKLNASANSDRAGLQKELDSKEKIINILSKQRSSAASIINFTRRFAAASAITAASEDDINYFRNNFIYLRKQFFNQQDMLDSTDFKQSGRFNLKTIPQFLEE